MAMTTIQWQSNAKAYHIHSELDAKAEAQLQAKLALADKCPYHGVLPVIIGPARTFVDDYGMLSDTIFSQQFPDALLFPNINWTCFCPECAKKNPTPGKHNVFGYGLCSQSSWGASLRNWNNSCRRVCARMILKTLNGS